MPFWNRSGGHAGGKQGDVHGGCKAGRSGHVAPVDDARDTVLGCVSHRISETPAGERSGRSAALANVRALDRGAKAVE